MDIIALSTLRMGKPGAYVFIDSGQSIAVAKQEAELLIKRGLAAPDELHEIPKDDLTEAILDAIGDLQPDAFGKDGKPNVKAIEDIMGHSISAADRDNAWEAYQTLIEDGQ